MTNTVVSTSAEELDWLLASGALERIGMGSRRACYRLPDGRHCLKCYRSDDEIKEGKYPGVTPITPLAAGAIREIRRYKFDERRNTCCQEYRYWLELRKRLPSDLMAAFPSVVEQVCLPSRGWALIEELVVNSDGSQPRRFAEELLAAATEMRRRLLLEFEALAKSLVRHAVRFYDTQNVIVQWLGKPCEGDDFRLRIVDIEPASRTLFPIDSLLPAFCRMKLRRRAERFLRQHLGNEYKPIPFGLRRRWEEVLASDGARLGLSGCRMFLENKMANDIFYEGMFKGRPCVVKCSSRAPDSIRNEYEMLKRVHGADAAVFPEPYALWTSPDGGMAFVAMEKIGGGKPADPAADILRIANALKDTGIVHRDISIINIICGEDGHLKLIDFQFAIDRNDYRESRFMRRNPQYLYVHFGSCEELGLGRWNDILGLGLLRCLFHFAPNASDAESKLREMAASMTFSAPVNFSSRCRIRIYRLSLRLQSLFNGGNSVKWRLYKTSRLLSGDVSAVHESGERGLSI